MNEGCISQLNHSLVSGYFCLGVMVGMTLRVWMRLTGELMMVYSSPSISGAGKAGVLLRKREAFPLARRTARPWYKCLILSDSSCPVCLARADPSFLICSTILSCQPPRLSVTRGVNTIPSNLQALADWFIYLF